MHKRRRDLRSLSLSSPVLSFITSHLISFAHSKQQTTDRRTHTATQTYSKRESTSARVHGSDPRKRGATTCAHCLSLSSLIHHISSHLIHTHSQHKTTDTTDIDTNVLAE